MYAIKFQVVATPDGQADFLQEPCEGIRHDSRSLRESGFLQSLEEHSFALNGNIICIYEDPACPLCPHLQAPFRMVAPTEE